MAGGAEARSAGDGGGELVVRAGIYNLPLANDAKRVQHQRAFGGRVVVADGDGIGAGHYGAAGDGERGLRRSAPSRLKPQEVRQAPDAPDRAPDRKPHIECVAHGSNLSCEVLRSNSKTPRSWGAGRCALRAGRNAGLAYFLRSTARLWFVPIKATAPRRRSPHTLSLPPPRAKRNEERMTWTP